ncbi:hypothetical protein Tco_0950253, partial [Tanacetum coccineum]
VETASQIHVTTSKYPRDDVKISLDDVKVADSEEAPRRFYGLTTSRFFSDIYNPYFLDSLVGSDEEIEEEFVEEEEEEFRIL